MVVESVRRASGAQTVTDVADMAYSVCDTSLL